MPLAMSEHHDLAGLFHSLSPDARTAAFVYGVVDPHVRTTWQVAQILRHADVQSRGRRLTSTRLQDAVRELVKHGLAYAPRRDEGSNQKQLARFSLQVERVDEILHQCGGSSF